MARAWLVVGLLAVVGCLNYLDRIMITTMRGSIVEAIPMTDAQFGLLTAVFLWIYGLLSPFAGFLADRFSRSRVIIGSLFVWSVVTWLTAYATTYNELLATRALMGISEACYIPAALSLLMDYHRGETRSLATGLHMSGIMIGQSLGFVGGMLADQYVWSSAFRIFGIVGVFYALVLVFVLHDAPSHVPPAQPTESSQKTTFIRGIRRLFGQPSFVVLLLFWGMLGMVGWLIVGWLPTYYKEKFKLSQGEAGVYATGYLHMASLVGVLLGGFLADRWSRTNQRARVLLPAIGLLLAAPGVFVASSTPVLAVAVLGFVLYALTRTFSDANLMPVLCTVVDDRYRATGYGVLNLFACVVGGLGIYAGGVLRDAHIDVRILFQIAAVGMVLCAGLLLLVKRK
jgi:MFS family permease